MLVTLKRILFILLAILTPFSLLAEERGPHIAAGFANKTVFAWTASRNSWNAFFASDGTVTYWHSDNRISKGTWRPVGDQVCVDLGNGPACRIPEVQEDATIDWLRPETQNASSTINFMLDGDELGLADVRSDDLSTTLRADVRTTYVLGGRDAPVQLASRRTYQEALTLMEQFRSDGIPVSVALARNGFFAVFAQPASGMTEENLTQLKNTSRIPSDAFFVDPDNYARIYHIAGSFLGSAQNATDGSDTGNESNPDDTSGSLIDLCADNPILCGIVIWGGCHMTGICGPDDRQSTQQSEERYEGCWQQCMAERLGTLNGRDVCRRQCY